MSMWGRGLLIIAVVIATGCAHPARSYPYVWQLRGAVVSVNGSTLQVRHKSGGIVNVSIDDETAFVKNKQSDSLRSLLKGSRVLVEIETAQRGVYRARVVQVFGGGRPW